MTAKLQRYKPTLGHEYMRSEPTMVPAPKGGYVDYDEALAIINRLERKLKQVQSQPDGRNAERELQHG